MFIDETIREFSDKEDELFCCLESAVDNIKKVLDKNPRIFQLDQLV